MKAQSIILLIGICCLGMTALSQTRYRTTISRDIRQEKTYYGVAEQLKSKTEYYYDFWSEQAVYHGKHAQWHRSGQVQVKGYYQEGLRDSIWLTYDKKGRLQQQATYAQGQLHGPSTYYYPNGQIEAIIVYQNGMKHGLAQYFDKGIEAKLSKTVEYRYGQKVTVTKNSPSARKFLQKKKREEEPVPEETEVPSNTPDDG